jgi:hypothetical protein
MLNSFVTFTKFLSSDGDPKSSLKASSLSSNTASFKLESSEPQNCTAIDECSITKQSLKDNTPNNEYQDWLNIP